MNLTYLCSGFINVFFPSVVAIVCRLKDVFMDKVLFLIISIVKIKRRNKFLLFAPNLTMNLTYLCSGISKMLYL